MFDINNKPLLKNAPFWSWNDKMTKKECKRQIEEMNKAGWGSFFMHARLGLVTPYLSEEWMELCRYCAETAEEFGMKAWLYDEDKWPSGYAGGIVAQKEENRQRELVLIKKEEIRNCDTVLMEYNYHGNTHYICRRVTEFTNGGWFNGYAYVDLMNPNTVRDFLDSTHEKYKEAMGDYFGKSIPGIFTDEPNNLFYVDGVTKVQWTDRLPQVFKEKYGYDLLSNLHKLFFEVDNYQKVRYDFYYLTTELFKEAFTKQYYDWCNENNLILTGHFMCEDYLWFQTQWSGDVMSHYEYMTWPGFDKLNAHLKQNATIKQTASVCDQLGKERCLGEIFALMGNHTAFHERKWVGDWASVMGCNFINSHLSLYSMRGERKRDCPANYFYQQPWWNREKHFGDYFARLCAFNTEGVRDLELLVLQPLTSVWCEYSPLQAKYEYGPCLKYDKPYEQLSKRFMEEKLDYHFGNENLMKKYASVKGDKFLIGKREYSAVFVPPCSNLMKSTYDLLKEFSANGGKLIFTNEVPYMIEGVPADISFENYEVCRDIEDGINVLKKYVECDIEIKDILTGKNAPDIWCEKRVAGNSAYYFLCNTNKDRTTKTKIILKNQSWAVLYDLSKGKTVKIDNYSNIKTDKNGKPEYDIKVNFDIDTKKITDPDFPMLIFYNDDGVPISFAEINFSPCGSLLIITGEDAKKLSENSEDIYILQSGVNASLITDYDNVIISDKIRCSLKKENVIVLNKAFLKIAKSPKDNVESLLNETCESDTDWGSVHHISARTFRTAPEGVPFDLSYVFKSDCELENCTLCLETAENLEYIVFNGEILKAPRKRGTIGVLDRNAWLDPYITKIKLPKIKKGINDILLIGYKKTYINDFPVRYDSFGKFCPTDCEDMYITGDFSLKREDDGEFILTKPKSLKGRNITQEGAPFYIGDFSVKGSFSLRKKEKEARYFLKLINAKKSYAELLVNGINCGISLFRNDIFDITDAVEKGKNNFEIVMATTLYNAFGPNKAIGGRGEAIHAGNFEDPSCFSDKYAFEDYGLEAVCIYRTDF